MDRRLVDAVDHPVIRWLRRRVETCTDCCRESIDVLLGRTRRRPSRLSLSELDAIPYVTEHGTRLVPLAWERIEQLDAYRYVRSNHRVLELGGCYGLVSCVINHNLADPRRHVVVEPAQQVIAALQRNRDTHQASFRIYNGVVARQPVVIRGEGLSRWTEPSLAGTVPHITIDELERCFEMSFNCLVADCEGGLEQFIRDFPAFFDGLDTILFERDREWGSTGLQCDYGFVEQFLQTKRFVQIKGGGHPVWMK